MIVKKIFLALSLCTLSNVQPDVTEKYIASTNRTEAMYELLATEAKQMTPDRKEQLLVSADKAIEQRKRETGLFHMWRDYKTLAYATLFIVPTMITFFNLGNELNKALDRDAAGIPDSGPPLEAIFAIVGAFGGVYLGLPFSLVYGSRLLNRTYAKERLADAQLIKKTIQRLPVV